MIKRSIVRGLWVAAVVAMAAVAQADNIDLVTGWNVNWNVSNSSTSPNFDIQIQNSAASANQVFNSYDLGLVWVLSSGAVSNQIAPNFSNPATVPFTSPAGFSWLNSSPQVTPQTNNEDVISNVATADTNYAVPNAAGSLATMSFSAENGGPAPGEVFDIYSDSSWSDYVNATGVSNGYNNDIGVGSNPGVLIGTVTVTGVPEPSSFVLLAVAAVGFAGYCVRRRCRAA